MHFAAYACWRIEHRPVKYHHNNVGGTANLLKVCAAFECRHFVFFSSCATYGVPSRLPLTEDDAQQPVNRYGIYKPAEGKTRMSTLSGQIGQHMLAASIS